MIDFDLVEESNIQRQIIHREGSINTSKSTSAAIHVKEINSACLTLEYNLLLNASNALDILEEYDVIVDASDNVATRYLLNDAAVLLNKPLVSGSALRLDGQLTVYHFNDGIKYAQNDHIHSLKRSLLSLSLSSTSTS